MASKAAEYGAPTVPTGSSALKIWSGATTTTRQGHGVVRQQCVLDREGQLPLTGHRRRAREGPGHRIELETVR